MFIASLLFGISASLDALLVGISYGIRSIRIRPWQNLAISLVALLGTCLSVGFGHHLVALLPEPIGSFAGSLILILLGLYYIAKWKSASASEDHTEKSMRTDLAGKAYGGEMVTASAASSLPYLTPAEVLTLSLTLSLNNLSAGLSASLAGLAMAPAALSTFLCSVFFLLLGNRLGRTTFLQFTERAADPLSGLLLIVLGILQTIL